MAKGKWLRIGQVKLVEPKNGEPFESMELDNESLKQFFTLLEQFGKKHLAGKSVEDIRTAQKLKYGDPNKLPNIRITRWNKTEEDYAGKDGRKPLPLWILADLLVDVEQF